MQWRETVTMGAPEGGHEVGALPLAAPGVAAMKVEVLEGMFRGALPGVGQGHPVALHGLCQGVPPRHNQRGPAPGRPTPCIRRVNMIKILWSAILILLGFERL